MNYQKLTEWIATHTEYDESWQVADAAIWFVATQEAEALIEENTVKGWAQILKAGIGPVDRAYVCNWLDEEQRQRAGAEESKEEYVSLESHLRLHFGLPAEDVLVLKGGKVIVPIEGEEPDLRAIAADLREKGMRCNCGLDRWEPERNTGHSWVCRIHKAASDPNRRF